jgi:hypothetical protein
MTSSSGSRKSAGSTPRGVCCLRSSSQVESLESLGLDELPDELLPRVLLLAPFVRLLREKHLHLDADQGRRHLEELAGQPEVQRFHEAQVLEVLLRDLGDGDVVDVDLVLPDQVEQEV